MPSACCIVTCTNRGPTSSGIKFYSIPTVNHLDRRRLWLDAIRREKWSEPMINNARVCSAHFISGRKSDDPSNPDYVPSIFHCNKERLTERKSMQKMARHSKLMERRKGSYKTNKSDHVREYSDEDYHVVDEPVESGKKLEEQKSNRISTTFPPYVKESCEKRLKDEPGTSVVKLLALPKQVKQESHLILQELKDSSIDNYNKQEHCSLNQLKDISSDPVLSNNTRSNSTDTAVSYNTSTLHTNTTSVAESIKSKSPVTTLSNNTSINLQRETFSGKAINKNKNVMANNYSPKSENVQLAFNPVLQTPPQGAAAGTPKGGPHYPSTPVQVTRPGSQETKPRPPVSSGPAPSASHGPASYQSKYGELLNVIEDLGREIKPTYAGSKMAQERLKKGIMHAKALVRECLAEVEKSARQ